MLLVGTPFLYSSYRISRREIVTLGLAVRAHQYARRLEWCQWESRHSHSQRRGDSDGNGAGVTVIRGRLEAKYDAEHHNYIVSQ